MMRAVGIAVMASACAAAGFLAADMLKKRLLALLALRRMVYYLKGEILYANATLAEALADVGKRFSGEAADLFLRAAKRMEEQKGEPFAAIWREEVETLSKDYPLQKEDRQALSALGENLGYADRQMQERTLLFYLEQLDGAADSLKKELECKAKLYRSLGTAAGLFLAVIMI